MKKIKQKQKTTKKNKKTKKIIKIPKKNAHIKIVIASER